MIALRITLIALPVVACGSGMDDWCGNPAEEEIVLVGSPVGWQQPLQFAEVWRTSSSVPALDLAFPVSGAVNADAGLLAVVDLASRDIAVFGLDGRWIGRWGQNDTPTPLSSAIAARWLDGALAVFDPADGKVVHFNASGEMIRATRIDAAFIAALRGAVNWVVLAPDGSILAQPWGAPPLNEGRAEHAVIRTTAQSLSVDTLLRIGVPSIRAPDRSPVVALREWPLPHSAISSSGVVATAGMTAHYRIDWSEGGRTKRLCRQVAARPSPKVDGEAVPVELVAAVEAAPKPPERARIGRLVFDSMDRLWVQRDLPVTLSALDVAIGREGALFDVYDETGRYLGEVQMPAKVRFLDATPELVFGLFTDDNNSFSVAAYRSVK